MSDEVAPATIGEVSPPRIILLLGYQSRMLLHFLDNLFRSLPRPRPCDIDKEITATSSCSHCHRPLPLIIVLSPVSPVDAIIGDHSVGPTLVKSHLDALERFLPFLAYIRGSIHDHVDLLRAGVNVADSVCICNSLPTTSPFSTNQQQYNHQPYQATSAGRDGVGGIKQVGPSVGPQKTAMATITTPANKCRRRPASSKSDDEVVLALWTVRSVLMMVKANKEAYSKRSSMASVVPRNGTSQEEQGELQLLTAGHRLNFFKRQSSAISAQKAKIYTQKSGQLRTSLSLKRSKTFGRLRSGTLVLDNGTARKRGVLSRLVPGLRWKGRAPAKSLLLGRRRRESIFEASYRAALVERNSTISNPDIIRRFGNAANPHKAAALAKGIQEPIIFTTCR